jgi:tricarballylate dehydrogenase
VEWLREVWGQPADNFIVRGTPYNTGTPLRLLLDAGAQSVGDPHECHAIAVDARAPKFDGGIVTRLDCLPFGIVVNSRGERFYDEGEDVWPKRYAIWGKLVARQPVNGVPSWRSARPIHAVGVSTKPRAHPSSRRSWICRPEVRRLSAFNRAVPRVFDHGPRHCRTVGRSREDALSAADRYPPWGYPRARDRFTYLGLKVNERAQV